ncbi:MAG TPA: PRC-barrel domain-containing protein [Methylomirabilota bacterium]
MTKEEFHLGAEVRSSDGKHVGELVHVLVSAEYGLRALVIKESSRFSGHLFSPGSMLLNDEFVVPPDAVATATHDRIGLKLTAAQVRVLPAYLAYRERSETFAEGLEDTAGVFGSGPEVPNWLEQVANKAEGDLEIDGGENVMLGRTGRKLGTVQDVLFDDGQLVGVVLRPQGLFQEEVILPRRFLDRSDDLALFANIGEKDVEQLTPFKPSD